MKIAFMFPGQGAQTVGMGKDLYEEYNSVRKIYNEASEISGINIADISFNSTQEELNKTENAQLAIATMSLGIAQILKENDIEPYITVGLSLGEYPALITGDYLSFNDGIKLLKYRGYFMGHNVEDGNYSMAAIIGLNSQEIEAVCSQISNKNMFITPANYNYSNQTVLSGDENAINMAIEKLREIGARKAVKLQTTGPFHTIKLSKAKKLYEEKLKDIKFKMNDKKVKVIKNLDGTFYNNNDNMVDILSNHIISPVRFDKAIKLMQKEKVDTYVELGPGRTLTGFIKKENRNANTININNVNSLKEFLKSVK